MREGSSPLGAVTLAAGLVLLGACAAEHDRVVDAPPEPIREARPWIEEFETGHDLAVREGKPLLLYFTAKWCGPCARMEHETFPDARVCAALEALVTVKINIDRRENQGCCRAYKAGDAIPECVLVDPDVTVRGGFDGLQSPDEFVAALRSIRENRPSDG